jgi:prolyl-tRNA synthetase
MRQSKLFGKTRKNISQEIKLKNHKYLIKGGFIEESVAGRYYFLPLGMRVRDKIIKVIEEEMDRAGAQKIITPVLHPLKLWQETNRNNEAGFELMTTTDRRGMEFVPGGTAEEMIVDLVRKYTFSYKDLPFHVYQFSQKFRDELRARGGLLRVREFLMKDGYSFHIGEKDFKKEYQNMWDTYKRIFDRLNLKTEVVAADNGYIGGDYCHEFVVENEIGESKCLMAKDGKYCAHEDIAKFKRGDINLEEKEKKFKIVEQPKWVQTMEDNVKHYKLPKSRFLKNVVYKHRVTGKIIIAVIRGDLEVNRTKLERVVDAIEQLEDAVEEDLISIGTKPGYVHSWGHKGVTYIGDLSLKTVRNFIGGQKEDKTDSINVNYGRDFKCKKLADIALAKEGYLTEDGKYKLIAKKGVEVGNIFQLGYHYSKKMKKAVFTDKDGKEKPYYMGCYGIGIGRTLATIVEEYYDDKGIIWPEIAAPYKVHLIELGSKNKDVKKKAEEIYQKLQKKEIEVLFDDRLENGPGEKFADSDLIGIPYRVIVSERNLREGKLEIKKRNEKKAKLIEERKLFELLK